MKKLVFLLFIVTAIVLSVPSCYYDNEVDLYGGNTCDTVAVSYANDIVPILNTNCYNCHDASTYTVSGYQFDDYTSLKDYVTNGSLEARTNDASSPMPPTELMDDCNRALIKAWIAAGAPNN